MDLDSAKSLSQRLSEGTSLVKHHAFSSPAEVLRAQAIELEAFPERGGSPTTPRLRTLLDELDSLTSALHARECGEEPQVDGVPVSYLGRAIDLSRRCADEDGRIHPRVGAVILAGDVVLAEAYRNEDGEGGHAEQIAVEKCADPRELSGATVITTLEPCTTGRSRGRRPCSEILLRYGVGRVVIGVLDPNPAIRGRAEILFRKNGVAITHFPSGLASSIWSLNGSFIEQWTREESRSIFLYSEPGR